MRIAALALFVTSHFLYAEAVAAGSPRFDDVRKSHAPSEATLLDRNGIPISEVRRDPRGRRLAWVPLRDLSPALQSALLASEDRRFFEHGGVDWQAFVGAMWDNLWRNLHGQRPRGASTLTMQLAGLLDPSLRAKGQARTLAQKWDQTLAARELEKHWTKQEILEAYLNLAPFRGELQGVHAASRTLFSKHPSGIDEREALLLSALLRGPNASPQRVALRACAVATRLPDAPDCEALQELSVASLSGRRHMPPQEELAPHLARRLLKHPGETVRTTLDAALQRFSADALRRGLAALEDDSVEDGAIVVLDNASGDVMAYVGSSCHSCDTPEFDAVTVPREASAMLKPFVYELAIEKRMLTAASILDDLPVGVDTFGPPRLSQGHDRRSKGPITVRTAIGSSMDIPAVRAWTLVGDDAIHERLRSLGITALKMEQGGNRSSLDLDGATVTLLEITNAFRALANGGEWSNARETPSFEVVASGKGRRVMPADATYIIADVLSDLTLRPATLSEGSPLASGVWTAVKFGMGKSMQDAWCIGFSNRYTVGVWLGNRSSRTIPDRLALGLAARIWPIVVDFLHRNHASVPPPVPPGVVSRIVSFDPPFEAARQEWFIAGTETLRLDALTAAKTMIAAPRIAYPTDGTVIALDSDSLDQRRSMTVQSRPSVTGLSWQINGIALPRGTWIPRPGRYVLELVDSRGRVIDAATFAVRDDATSTRSDESANHRSD